MIDLNTHRDYIDPDLPEGMVPEISPEEVGYLRTWNQGWQDGFADGARTWAEEARRLKENFDALIYVAAAGWLLATVAVGLLL